MGKPYLITESVGFDKPSRVRRDETTGEIVIEGVRYLGRLSKNKDEEGVQNEYPLKSRQEAEKHYEGLDSYVNHAPREKPERGYEEKIGTLLGPFKHEEDGSYANLHLNPKHPLAEQVAWDAEHRPARVGLSHSAFGVGGKVREGRRPITITGAKSVDIVASPATSTSLFESERPMADPAAAPEATPAPDNGHLLTESAKKIEALEAERAELQARLDEAAAREAEAAKRAERDALIAESEIPASKISDELRTALYEASDESAKALLATLKAAVFHETPESAAAAVAESDKHNPDAFKAWIG